MAECEIPPDVVGDLIAACEEGRLCDVRRICTGSSSGGSRGVIDAVKDNLTPLTAACKQSHATIVFYLISVGASVNLPSPMISPLQAAAMVGHVPSLRLLLENGAYVNHCSDHPYTALMVASECGHRDAVEVLLQHQAEVNEACDGRTALKIAATCGHPSVCEVLLKHGARMNEWNEVCMEPIIAASYNGHYDAVLVLIKHGAEVNAAVADGTALFMASRKSHVSVCELLLKHGADVNQTTRGWTPLMLASLSGHCSVCNVLIQYGASVNQREPETGTALILASQEGHYDIVFALLQKHAKVNSAQDSGHTALVQASRNGHKSVCELLLKSGACVNQSTENNNTPLMCASLHGQAEVCSLLLQHKADVNTTSASGDTALSMATIMCQPNIIENLILHGAHVGTVTKFDQTLLHMALFTNAEQNKLLQPKLTFDKKDFVKETERPQLTEDARLHVMRSLIRLNIDINGQDCEGKTALYMATQVKHLDIVNELLTSGVQVDLATYYDCTPLYAASANGAIDIMQAILKFDANPNAMDCEGRSCLFAAASFNHSDAITILQKHGADTNMSDHDGVTPLGIASDMGHKASVVQLIRLGADPMIPDNMGRLPMHKLCGNPMHEETYAIAKHLSEMMSVVSSQDCQGDTALHITSRVPWGHMTGKIHQMPALVLSLLMKCGLDPNIVNNVGDTALHVACQTGHGRLVVVLLKHVDISVGIRNNSGETCLALAVKHGHLVIASILHALGYDINTQNNLGMSLLHIACQGRNYSTYGSGMFIPQHTKPKLLEWLMKHIRVDVKDMFARTPVHLAALTGNVEAVECLVLKGGDPLARDRNGLTPIHMATMNFDNKLFKTLVNNCNTDDIDAWKFYHFARQNKTLVDGLKILNTLENVHMPSVLQEHLDKKIHIDRTASELLSDIQDILISCKTLFGKLYIPLLFRTQACENLPEFPRIKATMGHFIEKLKRKLIPKLPQLDIYMSGSMNEETKTTQPDECDFQFLSFLHSMFHSPGPTNKSQPGMTVILTAKENTGMLTDICKDGSNEVDRDRFLHLVYSAISEELKCEDLWKEFPMLYRRSERDITACARNITHLCLWWYSDEHPLMSLDADLVPSIGYPDWAPPPPWSRDDPLVQRLLRTNGCVAVAKWSESNENSFSLGFSKCDKELLDEMPPTMKQGLILAKIMKQTSLCPQIEVQGERVPEVGSLIDSYMLKTCMFRIYQSCLQGDVCVSGKRSDGIEEKVLYALMVYQMMEKAYREIPCRLEHFYLPGCNLLSGPVSITFGTYGVDYARAIQLLLHGIDCRELKQMMTSGPEGLRKLSLLSLNMQFRSKRLS